MKKIISKKIIIITVLLVVISFIISLIGSYYYIIVNKNSGITPISTLPISNNPSADTPAPMPTTKASVSNASKYPVAESVTVDIKNFSFNPSTLTVKTGTKVTWINNDNVSHTVTSDTMDPGNFLNSGILSPGQSFSFIFTSPVSVGYHCNIHPMMKGDVIIDVIVGN